MLGNYFAFPSRKALEMTDPSFTAIRNEISGFLGDEE
jgi:hypothetical protein